MLSLQVLLSQDFVPEASLGGPAMAKRIPEQGQSLGMGASPHFTGGESEGWSRCHLPAQQQKGWGLHWTQLWTVVSGTPRQQGQLDWTFHGAVISLRMKNGRARRPFCPPISLQTEEGRLREEQ